VKIFITLAPDQKSKQSGQTNLSLYEHWISGRGQAPTLERSN
jgi:hypothetical protein